MNFQSWVLICQESLGVKTLCRNCTKCWNADRRMIAPKKNVRLGTSCLIFLSVRRSRSPSAARTDASIPSRLTWYNCTDQCCSTMPSGIHRNDPQTHPPHSGKRQGPKYEVEVSSFFYCTYTATSRQHHSKNSREDPGEYLRIPKKRKHNRYAQTRTITPSAAFVCFVAQKCKNMATSTNLFASGHLHVGVGASVAVDLSLKLRDLSYLGLQLETPIQDLDEARI